MGAYVYSRISTDVSYGDYAPAPDGAVPKLARFVAIKGGAGVANKNIVTPMGVATQVSDDEAKFLSSNPDFLRHMERGFVTIRDKKADVDVVAADMGALDKSSPLTDADYAPGKAPSTEKPKRK